MKAVKSFAFIAVFLMPGLAKAVNYTLDNTKGNVALTVILTGGSHNEPPFVATIAAGQVSKGQRDCTQSITVQPISTDQIIQNPVTVGIPNQVCHHDWNVSFSPSSPIPNTNLNPAPMTGLGINMNSFSPD